MTGHKSLFNSLKLSCTELRRLSPTSRKSCFRVRVRANILIQAQTKNYTNEIESRTVETPFRKATECGNARDMKKKSYLRQVAYMWTKCKSIQCLHSTHIRATPLYPYEFSLFEFQSLRFRRFFVSQRKREKTIVAGNWIEHTRALVRLLLLMYF